MPQRRYDRPLRILLHTRASGGGGAERVFATLAAGLAARDHSVTLAVDTDEDGVSLDGVAIEVLGRGHATGVKRLAGLLRGGAFDVAAAAVSVSCVKLAAARTLALSSTPMVISFHGFEEWRTGLLSALAYRFLPVLSRRSAAVVAVSDGLRAHLVDQWGSIPEKTVRIYNPVALPIGGPSAADLAARPPLVAALGRLSREKGMDVLVEAFARVTHPGARLVIAGEGPERALLRERIATLGLGDRVRLAGMVAGPGDVFADARLAVAPSRTEAFGVSVVEALGYGLSVVATTCDGPSEILDGGRFGRLVPVGDVAGLALAIEAGLSSPGDPAPRLRRAADFSAERGISAWENLLAGAASGRRSQN